MNQIEPHGLQPEVTKQSSRGLVTIAGLSVVFGDAKSQTIALQPTDLSLEPGTFTAVIGPSGCGKSTLLNNLSYVVTQPDLNMEIRMLPN